MLFIQSLANELDGSPRASLALDMLEASDELAVDVDAVGFVERNVWVGSDTSCILSVGIPRLRVLDSQVDSPWIPCPPLMGVTGTVLHRRARRSKTVNLIKAIGAGYFL